MGISFVMEEVGWFTKVAVFAEDITVVQRVAGHAVGVCRSFAGHLGSQ